MNTSAPTDYFVREIDIHTLLPQQEPMVMIGQLMHFDMQRTVTRTTIAHDNIFVDANGCFSPSGIIENIAQTCAARIGYINRYINHRGIQIGFIGSISHLSISELPAAGQTIVTTVDIGEEIFGMILAHATVVADEQLIAETDIKIAVRDEEVNS